MNRKEVIGLILRYLTLVILAIPNLYLFYKIFTPATVYPVFYALKYLYNATLLPGNVVFFKGYYANIIPACIAGAAYYLLLILNLTTPMPVKKRIKSIVFLLLAFLFINIGRIILFATLFSTGYKYFDLTHMLTWYIGSTFLVLAIWFSSTAIFKIKEIPIYSDLRNLFKDTKQNDTIVRNI
jgi:exosortase/archaeosortase family protein